MENSFSRSDRKRKTIVAFYGGLKWVSIVSLLICLAALIGILVFVFTRGIGNLTFDFLFSNDLSKPSIGPAFVGTLYLILISLVIAFPLGLFTAIFLAEYTVSNSLPIRIVRIAIETLAGIPSIVYGLFGYLLFTRGFGGYSILGGGLSLAIMILPLIVRNCEEALLSVPTSLREASYALGAGKVRTIFMVVLPSSIDGILTSLILAIGRVISESAVLLLTIGMIDTKYPISPMDAGTSLALQIYYYSCNGYASEAAATSLVLIVLVLLLNIAAYFAANMFSKKRGLHRSY